MSENVFHQSKHLFHEIRHTVDIFIYWPSTAVSSSVVQIASTMVYTYHTHADLNGFSRATQHRISGFYEE